MIRLIVAIAATALLAGCGHVSRESIAVEVTSAPMPGTATLTCTSSSSGTCHVMFVVAGDKVRTASAATGKSVTVQEIAPGTPFCVGVAAPDAATCNPVPLMSGKQIIHHDRSVSA